jgi:hypothetical protein
MRASAADRPGDRASQVGFEVAPIAGRDGHAAQAWLAVDVRLCPSSPPTKPADIAPETCTLHQNRRNGMFEINGLDTAGVVSLKRLSLAAAVKKARELVEDGCWDVQVVDPNGRVYTSFEEQAA